VSAERSLRHPLVQARTVLALCRPALILLFALVTSIGCMQGGRPSDASAAWPALLPVMAFLVFAVAVNDLADEAIDRVNLAGDCHRPLVSGLAERRDMQTVAVTAAAVAVASACRLGWPGAVVVSFGLLFALAYSLEPIRLAKRGAVASMTLPLGYVAVPYALGVLAAGGRFRAVDVAVLAALYVAFIGRLVLKDFRDVRGDVLFGKRTFLVRHGRRRAIAVGATAWVIGAAGLVVATGPTIASVASVGALTAATLVALVALSRSTSARRDDALVAAGALLGRGTLTLVLAHGTVRSLGWSATGTAVVLGAVTAVTLAAAERMARVGPRTRLVVPEAMLGELGDRLTTPDDHPLRCADAR
jgi:4-hydroxybenzoate polyprenyltransferase